MEQLRSDGPHLICESCFVAVHQVKELIDLRAKHHVNDSMTLDEAKARSYAAAPTHEPLRISPDLSRDGAGSRADDGS